MKALAEKLVPRISDGEKEEIMMYHSFSKKFEKELRDMSMAEFVDHPVWGKLIKQMPKDLMEERNKLSQQLVEDAIMKGKWEPYLLDLAEQGVMYARQGYEFRDWIDLITLVRKYYVPVIQREYGNSPEEMMTLMRGMDRMMDIGMSTIGEAYIFERQRIIEEQKEQQAILIKDLESFAYIISHDLKTPLRGIANLSDWLIQDYSDKIDETGKEYLELMKNRVSRLEALIEGVLTYSRAGRAEAEKVSVDMNKIIAEVTEMISPGENVKLVVDDKLPMISFPKSAAMQVFSNLTGNAIKHNDKPKPEIHIGCNDKKSYWEFYVRDNGPGIEKEFHEKIFQIFHTLHTKDEMDSTGIGLTIVKKIIESAGGKIWLDSELKKGTTFYFTIKK